MGYYVLDWSEVRMNILDSRVYALLTMPQAESPASVEVSQ
jgi:hypothetical protein